jgi:hypothetical protein
MAAVVTNGGLASLTTQLVNGASATGLRLYLAVGTGSGTATVTDSAMFTEDTTTGRTLATFVQATKTVTNDSVLYSATLNFPAVNETITEVGLWTASTGGTLVYHRDLTGATQPAGPTAGVSSVTFNEEITL